MACFWLRLLRGQRVQLSLGTASTSSCVPLASAEPCACAQLPPQKALLTTQACRGGPGQLRKVFSAQWTSAHKNDDLRKPTAPFPLFSSCARSHPSEDAPTDDSPHAGRHQSREDRSALTLFVCGLGHLMSGHTTDLGRRKARGPVCRASLRSCNVRRQWPLSVYGSPFQD